MLVEACLGNPDFGSDFIHRHQVETFLGEKTVGRINDCVFTHDKLLLFERKLRLFTHWLLFRHGGF